MTGDRRRRSHSAVVDAAVRTPGLRRSVVESCDASLMYACMRASVGVDRNQRRFLTALGSVNNACPVSEGQMRGWIAVDWGIDWLASIRASVCV